MLCNHTEKFSPCALSPFCYCTVRLGEKANGAKDIKRRHFVTSTKEKVARAKNYYFEKINVVFFKGLEKMTIKFRF